MKLGAGQGFCRGSVTSPMMGSTPCGVAARRTCPSSVASLRGRATHAPADLRALLRATRRSLLHLSGATPGSRKVGSRMVQGGGRDGVGGFPVQLFGRGRPCDLQRQVPAVQVAHVLEGAPDSVH